MFLIIYLHYYSIIVNVMFKTLLQQDWNHWYEMECSKQKYLVYMTYDL